MSCLNFVKICIIDFMLFSLIEGYIFALFFEKIGGCKKFKWWQIAIMSVGNCIISQILPPLLYQIICILWMSLFINIFFKIAFLYSLKISILSIMFFLLTEVFVSMILEFTNLFYAFDTKEYSIRFLYIIPIRIVQFVLLKFNKTEVNFMKIFVGSGVVRK